MNRAQIGSRNSGPKLEYARSTRPTLSAQGQLAAVVIGETLEEAEGE
jgi:hypothetical protein